MYNGITFFRPATTAQRTCPPGRWLGSDGLCHYGPRDIKDPWPVPPSLIQGSHPSTVRSTDSHQPQSLFGNTNMYRNPYGFTNASARPLYTTGLASPGAWWPGQPRALGARGYGRWGGQPGPQRCAPGLTWTQDLGCVDIRGNVARRDPRCEPGLTWTEDLGCVDLRGGIRANPQHCAPGLTWTEDLGCVDMSRSQPNRQAARCAPGLTWTEDLGCVDMGRPKPKPPTSSPAPRGRRCGPGLTWTQDLGCVDMRGGIARRANPGSCCTACAMQNPDVTCSPCAAAAAAAKNPATCNPCAAKNPTTSSRARRAAVTQRVAERIRQAFGK